MAAEPHQLLRRLAAGDERLLGGMMAPTPEFGTHDPIPGQGLDRQTRMLVRLVALLAVGAPVTSLQWAVERAAAAGAGVGTLTGVMLAAAPEAGVARLVECAPRLALALGFDIEVDGWDDS